MMIAGSAISYSPVMVSALFVLSWPEQEFSLFLPYEVFSVLASTGAGTAAGYLPAAVSLQFNVSLAAPVNCQGPSRQRPAKPS